MSGLRSIIGRFLGLASVYALAACMCLVLSGINRRIEREINNYESTILFYVNFHNHCTDNLSSKAIYILHFYIGANEMK